MTNSLKPNGPIPAWSLSRLEVFESCPYRANLEYIERVPKPPLEAPPGKDEHPLERGRRIHDLAEAFVKKNIELPEELSHFEEDFRHARRVYVDRPETVLTEQQWAFDCNWAPAGWFSHTAWGRMVLDLSIQDETHLRMIDHKTGKKYGTKHIVQGQLYALVAFLRYPQLETINTEFWYLDTGDKEERQYSRLQALCFQDSFTVRGLTMTTATDFPPRPSQFACRFCPYGTQNGNGFCEYSFAG